MLYKNLMVTKNQKSIIDTHTKKKKIMLKIVSKSQEMRKKNKGIKKKKTYKNNPETINKMAIRTYM